MIKLKRSLGLFEATFYGIGVILGAGIYALIGEAAGLAGNSLWMSFIFGALVSSFTGLAYAELSSMYPKEAAEFVYVKKAYGSNFWAFLIGWLLIFTGAISVATVSLGFAGYFNALFGSPIIFAALILIVILSIINYLGIKESSRFNVLFTSVEIVGLLIVILVGFGKFGSVNYLEMPNGVGGILSASVLIFFAYLGFEEVVNISEETKKPRKIIPKALLLAIAITTILYVLVSVSVVSLANWKDLQATSAPIAFAASNALGSNAFFILSVIALFATANTVLGMLIFTSRMVFGMSREKTLPRFLSNIDHKRRTPWLAVIAVMIFSSVFVFLGKISLVANITSLGALITFLVINLSLIWLRYTQPKIHRPFRVPLSIGKYPLTAFLGVTTCMFMLLQFDISLLLLGFLVLLAGTVVYLIYYFRIPLKI